MIKININNLDIIKTYHRDYIKNNVEPRIDQYRIFNADRIEISNFISEFIKEDLYNITLESLEIEDLKKINKKYKKIKDKSILDYIEKDKMVSISNELNKYLEYIKISDGRNSSIIEKRKRKWEELCNLTYDISDNNIKIKYFFKSEINFNNKTSIISQLKNLIEFISKSIDKDSKRYKLEEIIRYIFNYDSFKDNESEWNRHKIIYLMGVEVCPYCNRNYITNYLYRGKEKTTADLDHFYCQDKYPYLALSIYNFIPSCQVCNSRFKIAKDFLEKSHIIPYKEGFDRDAIFRTKSNKDSTIDYILGKDLNFDIEIKINTDYEDKKERIENSIDTFKLEELYNEKKSM